MIRLPFAVKNPIVSFAKHGKPEECSNTRGSIFQLISPMRFIRLHTDANHETASLWQKSGRLKVD